MLHAASYFKIHIYMEKLWLRKETMHIKRHTDNQRVQLPYAAFIKAGHKKVDNLCNFNCSTLQIAHAQLFRIRNNQSKLKWCTLWDRRTNINGDSSIPLFLRFGEGVGDINKSNQYKTRIWMYQELSDCYIDSVGDGGLA